MITSHFSPTHCLLLAALLGLAALSACMPPPAQDYDLDCPEPVVEGCVPGSWNGVPFDTAAAGPGQTHLKIEPVAGLNSVNGEYSLAFVSETQALMTAGTGAEQRLKNVRLASAARGQAGQTLTATGMATFGASTLQPMPIFSGVSDQSVTGDGDIFLAETGTNQLEKIRVLDALNTAVWWDGHPALVPLGDIILFASERPGSIGGTDLYYSVRSMGEWSTPRSCGAALNTTCDELSPFVTADGTTLLFASSGHSTLGGYDIFSVELDVAALREGRLHQAFGTVENLGAPLNTAADELFPSTPGDHANLLYYASNQVAPAGVAQDRHGGFDLYVLHRVRRSVAAIQPAASKLPDQKDPSPAADPTPEADKTDPIAELPTTQGQTKDQAQKESAEVIVPERDLVVEGKVVDRETQKPIQDAVVTVTEVESGEVKAQTTTNNKGDFRLESPVRGTAEVSAQAQTYFPRSSRVDPGTSRAERGFELTASMTLRLNFPNDIYQEPYPRVLDSNGRQTNQTWQEAVTTLADHILLYQNSIKSIVLIGHTDEKSSEEYNLMLGRRRADFLKTQLVQRGVPVEMLVTNSAGETRPLVRRPNEDLETYHTRCRRVEIRKILRE